ncbi:hypothetical protein VMCG_09794 [Cytospora schulzeri]|uniref:Major facilitator superfamily (MFS) profile domain-containing protein n=1 Tax=Cytospora schulzeri TaxID=448051 RepID=A0A423VGK8_9PEZI|nr:hypothetical protein VMCG_09794 [Valsa malicola]
MADTEQAPNRSSLTEASDGTTGASEKRHINGLRWLCFVISSLTSIFVYSLDNTIVANIVPTIVSDLDAIDQLSWLSVGFMIGGMAMVLPFGKLYSIYDPKRVYIISTVIFLAASALCGAAPTMEAEIVGRVFAGAGGNGMYFGLIALLSVHTTTRERPQYLGYTGLCWGLGTVLGPAVGGAFVLVDWRWGFYINLIIGAALLPTYFIVIPPADPIPEKTSVQKLALLDWVGTLLSVGAMVTLIVAINFGGVMYPWKSGAIIALFSVSGVLWLLFALQQCFCVFTTPEWRIFPIHLLTQKVPVLLFFITSTVGSVAYVSVYYIPIYFQFTRGDSAIYTAVRLLPFICLLITAIPLSGHLMSLWGYYKPYYIIGSGAALITAVLMAHYVDLYTPVGSIYTIEIFLGAGAGLYTQSSFAVVQSVVSPEEGPNGLGLMMIAQLTGMTLGLSISGAIFVNTATSELYKALPFVPQNQVQQLIAGAAGNLLGTLNDSQRTQTLKVIVSSWQKTFIIVYVGAAVGLLCSTFLKNGKANSKEVLRGA